MRTSEVLNRAADLIEQRGWGQGSWKRSGNDPLCIEGAIGAAMGDEDSTIPYCNATVAVRNYLGAAPFMWNDDLFHNRVMELIGSRPEITRAEAEVRAQAEGRAKVIEVLRATAVIEAAKESELSDADLGAIAEHFENADVINGRLMVDIAGETVTFTAHRPVVRSEVSA